MLYADAFSVAPVIQVAEYQASIVIFLDQPRLIEYLSSIVIHVMRRMPNARRLLVAMMAIFAATVCMDVQLLVPKS